MNAKPAAAGGSTCGGVPSAVTSAAATIRHATAHARSTGHPVIRSFEPGEDWFWDYRSSTYFVGPELAPPAHHPADQTVPGPASRVPSDWEEQLH